MALKKTLGDMADEARQHVPEITAAELADQLPDVAEHMAEHDGQQRTPLVLDVREPDERSKGHIPTSLSIPRGVLERDIGKKIFQKPVTEENLAHPIVCYCGGGSRSLLAARSLQEMGFTNVSSLAGGFEAWEDEHMPIVTSE